MTSGVGGGRVVELGEQPVAFGRVQQINARGRRLGGVRQLPQDAHEAGRESLDRVPVEDSLRVLEDELEVRVDRRHQGQRVVGGRRRRSPVKVIPSAASAAAPRPSLSTGYDSKTTRVSKSDGRPTVCWISVSP